MNPAVLGPFCAFCSSLTWAVGSAGYSRLAGQYNPFSVNFGRALVALPLFVIAVFVAAGGFGEGLADFAALRGSHLAWFTLSMVASYGLGDVFFLWATHSLGVPGALAIASSYPLLTAVVGYLFQGEQLSALQLAGLLITVGGIVTVILNGPRPGGENAAGRSVSRGVAFAAITSVFWAINSFAVSRGAQELSAPVGNVVRMIVAMALSAGFARVLQPGKTLLLPTFEFRRNAWLFAVEAFGGSYFFVYGLANSPLAIGSTLSSLAPVISVPVALALGLEKFSFARTAGVCSAVVGIWLLVSGGSV